MLWPAERVLRSWISEGTSQPTGPHENPKEMEYRPICSQAEDNFTALCMRLRCSGCSVHDKIAKKLTVCMYADSGLSHIHLGAVQTCDLGQEYIG